MGSLLHALRDHTPLPAWAPVPPTQAGGVPILRDDNLHPVIAEIIGSHAAAPVLAQRTEYVALLASMDWQCDMADDGSVRRRGFATLERLRALQPFVDPERALYRAAHPVRQHGDVTL